MNTRPPAPRALRRGDIALVYFPFSDQRLVKHRPALVVQADNLTPGSSRLIVAMITTKLRLEGHPSCLKVDPNSPVFIGTGLPRVCLIATNFLATVDAILIAKRIGSLGDMKPIDTALRYTLAL